MKYISIILNILFIYSCSLSQVENKSNYYDLPILDVKPKELFSILDSIITHEKNCNYYSQNLIFSIHIRKMNNVSEFTIEAVGLRMIKLGDELGCFYYKNHLFFVSGENLETDIFMPTNEKITYNYYIPKEYIDNNTGEIFLEIIEDDSFSFWIYEYNSNKFTFKELHTYCK